MPGARDLADSSVVRHAASTLNRCYSVATVRSRARCHLGCTPSSTTRRSSRPATLRSSEAVADHRQPPRGGVRRPRRPFVVSDVRLPDLVEVVGETRPLHVSRGGHRWRRRGGGRVTLGDPRAGAARCAAWRSRCATRPTSRHNVRRLVAALDATRGRARRRARLRRAAASCTASPTPAGWRRSTSVAARSCRLKFRTGGVTADAFPTEAEVAAWIAAALDRELPFKCTAGLHNAVRHRDAEPASAPRLPQRAAGDPRQPRRRRRRSRCSRRPTPRPRLVEGSARTCSPGRGAGSPVRQLQHPRAARRPRRARPARGRHRPDGRNRAGRCSWVDGAAGSAVRRGQPALRRVPPRRGGPPRRGAHRRPGARRRARGGRRRCSTCARSSTPER